MSRKRARVARPNAKLAAETSVRDPGSGSPWFARVWPLSFAIAVTINIAQFAGIETRANRWYTAIPTYDSADVAEISLDHMKTVRRRYGLDFAIALYTDDPALTVFEGSGLEGRYQLRIAVDGLRVAEYDPLLEEEVAEPMLDHLVAAGIDSSLGEYGLALTAINNGVTRLIAVEYDDSLIIAEAELLPDIVIEPNR